MSQSDRGVVVILNVGDGIKSNKSSWSFDGLGIDGFNDHINRSVPGYLEGQQIICRLSDYFIKDDSVVYDLGCSMGNLTVKLAEHSKKSAQFIGIDNEATMINEASSRKDLSENISFLHDDVISAELSPSDLITAYYTVQFVRPSQRQDLINKIYASLKWGGAFIMFEKTRGADARFQDILTGIYNDYKLEQGYTSEEIIAKSQSLKGVLEPFSTQGNIDLLKRAGFVDYMTIYKNMCFEGFIAIK